MNNKISSIEPLKNLQNIKYICLDGNNLKNINAVQNWTNVIDMSFQNNQIEELPNLSGLTQLQSCNVSNNKIKTINNISILENLEKLEIDNNELISLEGIQNLANLKILSCSNNQIEKLDGLATLTNLRNLNINKNQIQDITKLKKNEALEYLYMDNNYILNFDVLSELKNLQKYSIYNQTISAEIKEKIVGDFILVPLPDLYRDLYDENNFINQKNIKTEVVGAENYEIDNQKQNIKLEAEDLEKNTVTIQVSDETNILLKYNIQIDKKAPIIEGVVNNQIYFEPVTPVCQDDDIEEVQLKKDEQQIEYELGNLISEKGQYILIIKDRAENETRIEFEIKNEIPQSEKYKIESQYITGITYKTTLEMFLNLLKTDVECKVYREETILENSQEVATGDKLITEYGKVFYLIVKGDITKDGKTNITDLVKMRKNLLKIEQFDELEKKAADITGDDEVTIKDLVQIRQIIINKSS